MRHRAKNLWMFSSFKSLEDAIHRMFDSGSMQYPDVVRNLDNKIREARKDGRVNKSEHDDLMRLLTKLARQTHDRLLQPDEP